MGKISFNQPTLLLVEHGETEFSEHDGKEDRIHGTKFDLPLTPKGREQSRKVAAQLRSYDIASIDHSPQLRTTQTARIIGTAVGVEPKQDERLAPLDAGYLSGMTHSSAQSRILYYVAHPHKQIPEGETYGGWYDAWSGKLASKLKEAERTPGKAHVLVLHSSEIVTAPAALQGEPPTVRGEKMPGSGQISKVEKRGGKWRMKEFGGEE